MTDSTKLTDAEKKYIDLCVERSLLRRVGKPIGKLHRRIKQIRKNMNPQRARDLDEAMKRAGL
jgi:hypothetical protein